MNNINKVKKICNAINNKFTFNTVCFTGHRSQNCRGVLMKKIRDFY